MFHGRSPALTASCPAGIPARRRKSICSGGGRSCGSSHSIRPVRKLARLVHISAPRATNQPARPMWSGWWWVTISRVTGAPAIGPASNASHAARVAAPSKPVSMTVQPSASRKA